MGEASGNPSAMTVEAVEWLPSGARSGLVRVRGRRGGASGTLPVLVLDGSRFSSLPESRPDEAAWRGAYVVDAGVAAGAAQWWLEWEGGARTPLSPPAVPAPADPAPQEASQGGEVVDRAVLAERRARRAEAAEQAQARIAREALRAVEVLELRAAEVEERLHAAQAERDALRGRAAADPELRAEVERLREELARREAEPPPPGDAERRAQRMQEVLAETLQTVEGLKRQLHEAEVHRRSREVAWSADAVRLTVLEREHREAREALAALRAELGAARAAAQAAEERLDEQRARAAGAEAAHDETRRRFTARVGELREAREAIARLESELAAVRAEASRSAAEAADAARAAERAEAEGRLADVRQAADGRIAELEERLGEMERALEAAERSRELAEASALAATAARRAAEVAHAAAGPAPPAPLELPARRSGEDLAGALAAAAERLKAPPPAPEQAEAASRVAADLDAAAEQLRRRATIVPAGTELPSDLARGQAGRAYPPLRGALVKLAHDDAPAAGRLLAGLLPALRTDVPFELTIAGVGTFAAGPPRGRRRPAFRARADALTLAEVLAGVGPKPSRLGRLRVSGSRRRARAVVRSLADPGSLEDALGAGADLDPRLALRCLTYAVHPGWVRGHAFTVDVDGIRVTAGEGGLTVGAGGGGPEPDAWVELPPGGLGRLLSGDVPPVRGDRTAVERLLEWADRARRGG